MGVVISDDQMGTLNLKPHSLHADWNRTVHPVTKKNKRVIY